VKVLFDQGVPVPLGKELTGFEVTTAYRQGWANLANGDLLNAAEQAGITVFVTTDQSLRYQQNLKGHRISILVLPTTSWPVIQTHGAEIKAALQQASPGSYREMVW
jgi:hypothetical protein